jgi:putative transposase
MYRRIRRLGGTYFFTLVTHGRRSFLTEPNARQILHKAIADCGKELPFTIEAFVLLPEHLHCLWRLPPGDSDYSTRWRLIKSQFTREWLSTGAAEPPTTASRKRQGYRAVWQRRFWEHTIEDDRDYWQHANYIHWNPVKHGVAKCPHAWPHSSFARWVTSGRLPSDWLCRCHRSELPEPDFSDMNPGE